MFRYTVRVAVTTPSVRLTFVVNFFPHCMPKVVQMLRT